ncbi:MAG: hypothetical protein HYZ27_11515 [Deltaproteobacteria bacterium]|nr:hypothetical protein [Deltaproteobacteria bacterium]
MSFTKTCFSSLAALCLIACGDSDPPSATTIESLVPASGEVSGWNEDPATGAPGVEVGKTHAEVEAKIDGDMEPFAAKSFVALARQHYAKDGYQLELRIWQMKDEATATALYSDLATTVSLYSALSWSNVSVGDAGRVADSGTTWWVNTRKKAYHVEARVSQKSVADATSRADVEAFAKAVVAKIP